MAEVLTALLALAAGVALGWLYARGRWQGEVAGLTATLEHQRRAADEQIERESQLREAFEAMSADALQRNNRVFLDLARTELERVRDSARGDLEQRQQAVEHLVSPIRESLGRFDEQVREIERERTRAYAELGEQVRSLSEGQRDLRTETARLVTALRQPGVRGRWGEMQLRRVVETAGMLVHCDFTEQTTVQTEDGRLRPDVVIRLPGERNIVIDAKTPLQGCLDAYEATDDVTRATALRAHARQLRDHVGKLSNKSYWSQFEQTPDYVVMFIPGESFFSVALEQDPTIIEVAAAANVMIATPTTLIAMLRMVAMGWNQERVARSAQEVADLGRELHKRLKTMAEHLTKVGTNLDRTVREYNRTVGSFESRVLVTARKFDELGVAGPDEIEALAPVERLPRPVLPPQLTLTTGEDDEAETA